MAKSKTSISNIIFFIIIALLLIPQTRQPIQIMLHKGIALFGPSVNSEENSKTLMDYHWQLLNLNTNKTVNLSDYRDQVVFVNLWATWCPPCIAEMPSIQELYNDYSDDVVFLLISNENPEVINKFFESKGYNMTIYAPLSESPEILKSTSIPRTFLIDKNGKILIDKSGASNWNSQTVRQTIQELIK